MTSRTILKQDRRIFSSVARFSLTCAALVGLAISVVGRVATVPQPMLITIMRAEDERRWDDVLKVFLSDPNPAVRERAALAAGRIGDAGAVEPLSTMLANDSVVANRAMAAFALGETELPAAIDPLTQALARKDQPATVRARVIEGLGKIVAVMPRDDAKGKATATVVLTALKDEGAKGKTADTEIVLKGLTAVLRSRPEGAGPVLVQFLDSSDARIRADVGNTLARLKLADANEKLRGLIKTDPDAVVRANAARVLGATTDKTAYDALLDRALNDRDQRVRVSAIRSLGALKDPRAVDPLVARAVVLSKSVWRISKSPDEGLPRERPELLELANALGNIKAGKDDDHWARSVRELLAGPGRFSSDPEVETALAKASPFAYVADDFIPADLKTNSSRVFAGWQITSSVAQGLGAIAELKEETYGADLAGQKVKAAALLRLILADSRLSGNALGDVLSAYAAFKPADAAERLRKALDDPDFVVRATAAGLLADLGPDLTTEHALIEGLPRELQERQANDAALAFVDALGKQKTATANEALKTALASPDILVRRRAAGVLKDNGAGDFSARIGTVKSQFTDADYARALARHNGTVKATVTTTHGVFVIDFLPDDAPMTVDSFVSLARRKYFDRIVFHRVVPNFVVQTGDPRGDGNGGPGFQIRCEINYAEYDRGAVGMALSGKDTGGSQWFVTHSRQPHLDGGYTVFGRVAEKYMPVIDAIARGDKILSIRIVETGRSRATKR
jgi:cyclophilin family peptidyl-prolyl cis-trans isomerase/HEAT repeat protein